MVLAMSSRSSLVVSVPATTIASAHTAEPSEAADKVGHCRSAIGPAPLPPRVHATSRWATAPTRRQSSVPSCTAEKSAAPPPATCAALLHSGMPLGALASRARLVALALAQLNFP